MFLAKKIEESIIESTSNGRGFRIVLFTCGCPHHCRGCHNKETWNISNGVEYSVEDIANYLVDVYIKANGFYDGFTFSGGDPLYQEEELYELLILLKEKLKDYEYDVWIYTGYIYEEIKDLNALILTDYLIDGKYIKEERIYPIKPYRGSNNQRLLKLKNGKIVSIN